MTADHVTGANARLGEMPWRTHRQLLLVSHQGTHSQDRACGAVQTSQDPAERRQRGSQEDQGVHRDLQEAANNQP